MLVVCSCGFGGFCFALRLLLEGGWCVLGALFVAVTSADTLFGCGCLLSCGLGGCGILVLLDFNVRLVLIGVWLMWYASLLCWRWFAVLWFARCDCLRCCNGACGGGSFVAGLVCCFV